MKAELARRRIEDDARRKLYSLYPDDGPLGRAHYPKHMEFFRAGAKHNERAFIAGNRVGKTYCVCYEATCHMIGWYPHWWEGRRFDRPVVAWASGEDAKAVRESLQPKLLGTSDAPGTGLIPGDHILDKRARGGIPDALDFVLVKHANGVSRLVFKAYEQGRESYQASEADIMLFDEEPPLPVYSEGLTRTMSTVPGQPNGIVLGAFTPLKGISSTVMYFLPSGAMPASETERMKAWGW